MQDSVSTNTTFRAWLRDEMEKRRWNESELGRQTGILPSVINRWGRGEYGPNANSCVKIANALGVDPQFVMELAGHKPRQRVPESTGVQQLLSAIRYIDWEKPSRLTTVMGILRMYQDEDRTDSVKKPNPKAHLEV
jgi:transcriptional regulator with XRE-family HTH domain